MTANTARGYPYMEGGDFLGDVGAGLQALAEAVDTDVTALPAGVLDEDTDSTNGAGVTFGAISTIPGLSVTVTVPAGQTRKVRVEFSGHFLVTNGVPNLPEASLYEGATAIDRTFASTAGANYYLPLRLCVVRTLTAGTYTYTVKAGCSAGTIQSVGSTSPMRLWATDEGAA